jgi:hypothetical protein
MRFILPLALAIAVASPLHAQLQSRSISAPATPALAIPSDPKIPPARSFSDPRSGVSFQVPAGWALTRKDHEVSTFNLDARSVTHSTQMRAVANITFNPFPLSTFSGAYFYSSLTPHVNDADCARQAARSPHPAPTTATVGATTFTHGYDEHGGVCTESRDEIYTTARNGSCYRFDLVINNFCGGDVSGVRDMTPQELESVLKRLQAILATVQFDKK